MAAICASLTFRLCINWVTQVLTHLEKLTVNQKRTHDWVLPKLPDEVLAWLEAVTSALQRLIRRYVALLACKDCAGLSR